MLLVYVGATDSSNMVIFGDIRPGWELQTGAGSRNFKKEPERDFENLYGKFFRNCIKCN